MLPERHASAPGFQIPARRFNRSLRHPMTAHAIHNFHRARWTDEISPHDHRRQELFQRVPSCLTPLVGIERPFTARAFAPPLRAVVVKDACQNDPALSRATKTGLEKMN